MQGKTRVALKGCSCTVTSRAPRLAAGFAPQRIASNQEPCRSAGGGHGARSGPGPGQVRRVLDANEGPSISPGGLDIPCGIAGAGWTRSRRVAGPRSWTRRRFRLWSTARTCPGTPSRDVRQLRSRRAGPSARRSSVRWWALTPRQPHRQCCGGYWPRYRAASRAVAGAASRAVGRCRFARRGRRRFARPAAQGPLRAPWPVPLRAPWPARRPIGAFRRPLRLAPQTRTGAGFEPGARSTGREEDSRPQGVCGDAGHADPSGAPLERWSDRGLRLRLADQPPGIDRQ